MGKFLILGEAGAVLNAIDWDGQSGKVEVPKGAALVEVTGDVPAEAGPGWTRVKGEWTPPTLVVAPVPALILPAWRFWAEIEIQGLTTALDKAIAGIPDPTTRAIAWAQLHYSPSYERSNPLFDTLGAALGLTPESITNLFAAAAALPG